MQDSLVDKKIQVIYDNYKDNLYAKNAQKEVQQTRRHALKVGAGISTLAFVGNEVARLSMRSPLFKLKAQNVLFWLVAPSFMAKQACSEEVEKRIENMWRTHKNRVDKGLGPTWSEDGFHESMKTDRNMTIPMTTLHMDEIWEGAVRDMHFDNPFNRWHKSFENYPAHMSDMDDYPMHETDEFERFKKYKAAKKDVVGVTPIIPRQDNDEAFEFYDIQGESLYSNPPPPSSPVIDHGVDEEYIWAFPTTLFNQQSIRNTYSAPGSQDIYRTHAPFWGEKLTQMAFHKREKLPKFYRHWQHRLGLEALKMEHGLKFGNQPTDAQRQYMKNQLANYIDKCEKFEEEQKLADVYVTDHVAPPKKVTTASEEEDQDLYDYEKSLEDYNKDDTPAFTPSRSTSRYERGSLLQRIMDPFAHATRDENNAIVHTVTEKDIAHLNLADDEVLKAEYDQIKTRAEVWDVDEEDEDAWRIALLEELETERAGLFKKEDFDAVLDKELAIFGKNEKYDYVKDLKEAYKESLATSTEAKIFATIPDHHFWDIKKPQQEAVQVKKNRYNPFRGAEFDNFFEMRDSENYMAAQHKKENRNDAVSMYRRY